MLNPLYYFLVIQFRLERYSTLLLSRFGEVRISATFEQTRLDAWWTRSSRKGCFKGRPVDVQDERGRSVKIGSGAPVLGRWKPWTWLSPYIPLSPGRYLHFCYCNCYLAEEGDETGRLAAVCRSHFRLGEDLTSRRDDGACARAWASCHTTIATGGSPSSAGRSGKKGRFHLHPNFEVVFYHTTNFKTAK